MSGELRLSSFRYTSTPDNDFVIGSPYTSAIKDSKYLVFQVNTAVGYGSNPHIRCEWIPDVSSWRLRFSHDGTQINDFALTNTNNNFLGINTFSGPVTFNNDVQFNHDVVVQDATTIMVPTRPLSDNTLGTKYAANTAYVKNIIETVTVHAAAETNVSNDTTLNSTVYPTWVRWDQYDEDGHYPHSVSSTKLSFNPSTGDLSATKFSGSGAGLTSIPAGQLTGTFSNVSFNLGTTSVALNRAATEMGLTGITSLTGSTLSLGATVATQVNLGTGPVTNVTNVDGTTLNLGDTKATAINLGTAATTQSINIGTGSGVTTINIGGVGDTVNIIGTLANVNTTNLEVTDKTVTLNNGGALASGESAGLEVEENGIATGSIKIANSRQSWDLKAPANSGTLRLTPSFANFATTILSPATANITLTLPNETCTLEKVGHTQDISTISDATTLGSNLVKFTNPSAISFIRINADNSVSALNATDFRTAIGAGTSSTTGTVTSVNGTGSVSGLTLSGSITTSGSLTLGGTLAVTPGNFASQLANTFLASPNGTAGTPTFRGIAAADIPSLDASKITTGTLSTSIMPIVPTAAQLANTVTLQATNDVSWSISFNGSEATLLSAVATIADTKVTGKQLTNYTLGSNTAIAATDSILQAFGKVQSQITNHTHTTLSGNLTLVDLTLTGNEYLVGANKGISIGSSAVNNIPYINFNSSGLGSSYDSKIYSTNGSSTNGQASLTIESASVEMPGILNMYGNMLNVGNPFAASDNYIDFHTSGLGNDWDVRLIASQAAGPGNGTGILTVQADEIHLGTDGTTEVRFGGATAGYILGSGAGNIRVQGSVTGTGNKAVDIASGYGNSSIAVIDNVIQMVAATVTLSGSLVAQGDVTAINSASDERLKKDIKEIDNAVEKVKKLKGVTFKFNDIANNIAGLNTEETQVGVIAQDLVEVLPELTFLAPFNKDGSDYKMVKYDRIVSLLIQAVKEQQIQIDELKSKLNLN